MIRWVRRVRQHVPANWELWRLSRPARWFIVAVNIAALVALATATAATRWHARDAELFAALAVCVALTVEATRKIRVVHGTINRSMDMAWYLAAAVTLPPFWVIVLPLAAVPLRLLRMAPGVTYRRVVSGSASALAFGLVASCFGMLPQSLAGPRAGLGLHSATWLAMVACFGAAGIAINNALIIVAIKLADPGRSARTLAFGGDALVADLCEAGLGTLIAIPASIGPVVLPLTLPVVVVMRRFTMHSQLVDQARKDAKTGLLNATAWQSEAEAEHCRATRTARPLAIAIADIDHFKAVNDQHGHLAGDAALQLIAATLAGLLREGDLLGRFGGEEFAICLPGTGASDAILVAERLRTKISCISTPGYEEVPIMVTISIGIATMDPATARTPTPSLDELIIAADTALYQAKNAGRNCVRCTDS